MTCVIPPHVIDAPPPVYADSLDIPVLFRDGPARRPFPQWRTAWHLAWGSAAAFPASDGWYAPTSTWREIIKAATEVGRDVTSKLQQVPQLAQAELVARIAPLYAYLGLHDVTPKYPLPQSAGRRLTLNAICEYGTERTAKNALCYRLGMTMADWAVRALMGLGQTWHIKPHRGALRTTASVHPRRLPPPQPHRPDPRAAPADMRGGGPGALHRLGLRGVHLQVIDHAPVDHILLRRRHPDDPITSEPLNPCRFQHPELRPDDHLSVRSELDPGIRCLHGRGHRLNQCVGPEGQPRIRQDCQHHVSTIGSPWRVGPRHGMVVHISRKTM